VYSARREPFLIPQWREKVYIGVLGSDLVDSRQREMVVVIVGYDYDINEWYVVNMTRRFRVSCRTHPREWRAPVGKYWIEEDSQPSGKFDVVASVS
jgi:hypothetical protein